MLRWTPISVPQTKERRHDFKSSTDGRILCGWFEVKSDCQDVSNDDAKVVWWEGKMILLKICLTKPVTGGKRGTTFFLSIYVIE
jgi:hypothetical protein